MKKCISVLLTIMTMFFCLSPFCIFASEKIDNDKMGSISVAIKSPDKTEPIEGITLNLYRVGDVSESGNSFEYTLADGYGNSGASLKLDDRGEFSKETPIVLKSFVEKNHIAGISVKTNDKGTAFVGNCKTGLYLVMVAKMPKNVTGSINPFLIALPSFNTDGTLEYAVKASPKISLDTTNPTTTDKNSPTTSHKGETTTSSNVTNTTTEPYENNKTTNPNENSDSGKPSQLPKTGMLKWPVPILATVGPVLFAFGYLDVIDRKKRNEK